MGNGDALPEARRTELFAREQRIVNRAAGNPVLVLEENAGLFEHAFLAAGLKADNDVFGR